MTKVCHMTSAHQPEDERIFFKEAVSLAKNGYETYLVCRGERYEKNGVHIVGVGQPAGGRFSRMTTFARRIYQVALELDAEIYHFHDPELLPYGLKLKKRGKKVIFDSHEHTAQQIMEKEWIPILFRKTGYSLFAKYQKYVCSRLDMVISVSPHICDYFKELNPSTYMIANYPVLQEKIMYVDKKENSICFAGGISAQWCHKEIIRAMEQVDECEYYLCGKTDSSYFQMLTALPAWKRVHAVGQIQHETVHQMLAQCCIGLSILNYSNNSGGKTGTMGNTKIFEEMMAGLPVICTNFTLWKEFVERYQCGICIEPTDVDAIAAAIRYLLQHPEEARRMGENGRRAVQKEFNWGVEEKKLLDLYNELNANNNRA